MFRNLRREAGAALLSYFILGLVGAIAALANQPWLFPSLGPTVFLHVVSPNEPTARPWNTLVGHAIGIVVGFGALFVCGAHLAPSAFAGDALSGSRVAATALAVGAAILLQTLANAKHPPAAATTMLITLGGMKPAWATVLSIAIGVALVTAIGCAAKAVMPCVEGTKEPLALGKRRLRASR